MPVCSDKRGITGAETTKEMLKFFWFCFLFYKYIYIFFFFMYLFFCLFMCLHHFQGTI